uniref:Uncharacterized protein n=1 Tax=Arundo donax TaxID=35708 RepID=A0A0A9ACW0_ARUDO
MNSNFDLSNIWYTDTIFNVTPFTQLHQIV